MRITCTERFQRDFKKLSEQEKNHFYSVLPKIQNVLGKPHLHGGIGIRKLHSSGIYEVRMGLRLRVVFGLKGKKIILHRIGDHETVQAYLKNL